MYKIKENNSEKVIKLEYTIKQLMSMNKIKLLSEKGKDELIKKLLVYFCANCGKFLTGEELHSKEYQEPPFYCSETCYGIDQKSNK